MKAQNPLELMTESSKSTNNSGIKVLSLNPSSLYLLEIDSKFSCAILRSSRKHERKIVLIYRNIKVQLIIQIFRKLKLSFSDSLRSFERRVERVSFF